MRLFSLRVVNIYSFWYRKFSSAFVTSLNMSGAALEVCPTLHVFIGCFSHDLMFGIMDRLLLQFGSVL